METPSTKESNLEMQLTTVVNQHNPNTTSVMSMPESLGPSYAGSHVGSYAGSHASHMSLKEERNKAKHDAEDIEKEQAEVLKQKNPLCSFAWTIADHRYMMMVLQVIILIISGFAIYLSLIQSAIFRSKTCSDAAFGPYLAFDGDSKQIECPWPDNNTILHSLPAFVGVISSVITLIVSLTLGRKVSKDVTRDDGLTGLVEAEAKREYFDIYSITLFRVMRKFVGWSGYEALFAFGVDAHSYLIGQEYATSVQNLTSTGNPKFQYLLFIMIPLVILLRLSHDAMYQREYKYVLYTRQEIQGATVRSDIKKADDVLSERTDM